MTTVKNTPTTGRTTYGEMIELVVPVQGKFVKKPFTHAFRVPGQEDQLYLASEARKTIKMWSEMGILV